MDFRHYEINTKELKKALKTASKNGRMIDSKQVIQGHSYLHHVECKSCEKIPLNYSLKQC